jgi:hypothetical protein
MLGPKDGIDHSLKSDSILLSAHVLSDQTESTWIDITVLSMSSK